MINYPAVLADRKPFKDTSPAGLLHHGFFSTISRSNNNLSSRLIKSSLSLLLLFFLHLQNSSRPQGPLSLRFSRSLSESHSVGCENHRRPRPGPPAPGCRRPQAAALLPRRTDANNNTHKHVTSRRMLYTQGIKRADVTAHTASFLRLFLSSF